MKITRLLLENVAGLMVGLGRDHVDINFDKSKNRIVLIEGSNSSGKSTLLSSMNVFATTNSLDDRSGLSYIIEGKNGFKQIELSDGDNTYVIKHYFKWGKESHSVKSYFSMNNEELNVNGNVTSFLEIVETHMGITPEMMRLVRLGSNVKSFISLSAAERKTYLGKLISEIELYLKIYKKINEDIRVIKVMMTNNTGNLYNCHISDVVSEEDKLKREFKRLNEYELNRDTVVSRISKIESMERENNIDELRRKKIESVNKLNEISKIEDEIGNRGLTSVTVDELINKRTKLINDKVDIQSKINSYRISIDTSMKSIERLELTIKKIGSGSDITSLINNINTLEELINSTTEYIIGFNPTCNSDDLYALISKLSSFNQIGNMIYSLGNKPIEIYVKIKQSSESVDKFLKDQIKLNLSNINEYDLKRLLTQLFGADGIVTPLCDVFKECQYYRLATVLNEYELKLNDVRYDDETLNYIQVINNNIDTISEDLKRVNINIPDGLRDKLKYKSILNKLNDKQQMFDVTDFQNYLTLTREHEIYLKNLNLLNQYKTQLSLYKQSGVDNQLDEIDQLKQSISFYNTNISTLNSSINLITNQLNEIDSTIVLVSKYKDSKEFKKLLETTLESTIKLLQPLESSSDEKLQLRNQLTLLNKDIELTRDSIKIIETKLTEYRRLIKESEVLKKKFDDLSVVLESVSTRKGIPVLYMKNYLERIQTLSNTLLKLVYEDDLKLHNFKVTQDVFEIPYVRNGTVIPDVKYASQSELSLISMALSFALSNRSTGKYNILLLDEVDGGLDAKHRSAFLTMLDKQMNELNSEQSFIVSHNLQSFVTLPMDVIRLSDVDNPNRLQNIIYDASE